MIEPTTVVIDLIDMKGVKPAAFLISGGYGFLQKGTPNLRVGRQGVPDPTELLGRDVAYCS